MSRGAIANADGNVRVYRCANVGRDGSETIPTLTPDEARELAFDLLEAAAEAEDDADLDDMRPLERRAFALIGDEAVLSANFMEHPDEDVDEGRIQFVCDLDALRGDDE